jgi:hypothetical protein
MMRQVQNTSRIDASPRHDARQCQLSDPYDHHLFASLGYVVGNMVIIAQAFVLDMHVDVSLPIARILLNFSPYQCKVMPLFEDIPKEQSTWCEYDGKPLQSMKSTC